ncbi:MAG TPA: M56 family metallopeptidase [Cellvibrio sp.]|nr:M56 family metallopeptidase [Cellvibrio sp.]
MESLTTGLNIFTEWLLIASIKSVPLIMVVLIAQRGLKKYFPASTRHCLWLCVYICLSSPVGWEISIDTNSSALGPISETTFIPSATTTNTPEEILALSAESQLSSENSTAALATDIHHSIDMYSLLSFIWLAIFCCLSLITLVQALRFSRIKNNAIPADIRQEKIFEAGKHKLAITRKIPLLYSTQIQSPLTLGLFKPVVILPVGIEQQLSANQLNHILLHELVHIQRHDILWNWLAYWLTILHWFNPLVWYANKKMKTDMEMACDAKVLTYISQHDRNDYGITLINVSQLTSKSLRISHSLGILENHSELKNRLIMIKEYTTMTVKKSIAFSLILGATSLIALAQPDSTPSTIANDAIVNTNHSMTLAEFAQHAEKDLKTPILVGQQFANLTIPVNLSDQALDYGKLLSQLKINEFTAYKSSGYIQIVPARDARWLAIPTVETGKTYFDDEYVTDSIKLEKTCAGSVLATLRPLVPQFGHLTTMESANILIISDFYSNIMRLKTMVKTLEDNTPTKVDCANTNSPAKRMPTPIPEKK